MTTLVTADLHLGDNPRDSYRQRFMEALPAMVEEYGARRLLILGDLTEEKDRHGAWLVNQIVGHINALAEVCSVYIIRGNHDYIAADHPYYEFVSKLKNVWWYNHPESKNLRGLGNCLFLPHTTNYERDWEDLDFGEYDWIFAHQTFSGADVGHGKTLEGIPRSIFTRARARGVVAGDIHVPQYIKPVTYVGAPYTVDFGDDYDARILVLDGKKMESIPWEGPQKRLVDISDLKELKKQLHVHPGDIIKVRFQLNPADMDQWPDIQAEIRAWGASEELVVHSIQLKAEGSPRTPESRSKSSPRSDNHLLEEYVKLQGASKTVLKTGLRLMEKA
jgi:hypothetical protein